jgi:hypothetical protein
LNQNQEWGARTKKVIKLLNKTMNECPKCHLHIPQPRKGIYVLNIIVQNILEKKGCEGKGSQRNIENLNALNRDTKIRWE